MDKKTVNQAAALFCTTLLLAGNTFLYADPEATTQTQASVPAVSLTADQLNSLVAPIALYPDELVSQILVASTYPLEIVQAYQWLQQNSNLKGQDLTTAAQKQSWDPSVQALVAFPDLLKRLNQDVTWVTNLGNAFLADQTKVMDSIQQMRTRAQESGKLTSTDQQKVTTTTDNGRQVVVIEPARPDVVYVPDYDPVWIWGAAPVYYPYPYWYYPPRPAYGLWCWWGAPIIVGSLFVGWNGWGGWGWHPGWGHRAVVVNTTFVSVNHFNTVHVTNVRGVNVWQHSAEHRIGVAYPNRGLSQHYSAPGHPAFNHVTVTQAREQFHQSAIRVNTMRAADHFGSRQINAGGYSQHRSVFGGMESGANARATSSRGYSSIGHTQSASPAPGAAGRGASHGSGGWGNRGEGGGGHGGGFGGGHR